MKKIIILFVLFFASQLKAQNVAFVSQENILATMPKFKENTTRIDSLKKVYIAEINVAKEKISTAFQTLLTSYKVTEKETLEEVKKRMNATDVSKLELLIDEDKLIDKKAKNFEMVLNSDYAATVQPILDTINNTISSYAVKNKIDVVYILEQMKPALAYIDKKKDITQVIIQTLK
jgi:Skp family chaperone for outer membrane proteins